MMSCRHAHIMICAGENKLNRIRAWGRGHICDFMHIYLYQFLINLFLMILIYKISESFFRDNIK